MNVKEVLQGGGTVEVDEELRTRLCFAVGMAYLGSAFHLDVDGTMMNVYWPVLGDMDGDEIRGACGAAIALGKEFPVPSVLAGYVTDGTWTGYVDRIPGPPEKIDAVSIARLAIDAAVAGVDREMGPPVDVDPKDLN